MKKWIHISDLHFGSGQVTSKRMQKELLNYLSEHPVDVNYLFITGDLVFAPKATQDDWGAVVEYIEKIQEILKIEKENTFLVPGNHDVKRNDLREALVADLIKKYDSHDGTINASILGGINSTYENFIDAYQKICNREHTRNHFVEEREDVNIVHIDTALSYSEKNQDRYLILGAELIESQFEKIDKSKPGIALAHHSFDCLADSERIMLETILKDNNVSLYLCGHEHKALYRDIQIIDQEKHLFEYLCGSDMDRGPNYLITDMDFFVGTLNDDGKSGYIDALRFSRDNKKFLPDIEFSTRQSMEQQDGRHYFPTKK